MTELSPVKRALLVIEHLEAKVRRLEAGQNTPIAIVGIGCRLPGSIDSADGLWQALREGRDTIREMPADRWDIDSLYDPTPGKPGKMYTRHAALLDDVRGFDPACFSVTPREALGMDPQQRLLLESTWQALEDAGVAPDSLKGSATGVFVGIANVDFAQLMLLSGPSAALNTFSATGLATSVAAGRLSYTFGLRGPTLCVDSACSSSLVAAHLACQSLRSGECDLALACGVNLILSPVVTLAFCQAGLLSPTGRCHTFDDAADGYVRGEACGVVVLKRLADAERDGDPIHAVILGSATNHDGRSAGMTAPSGAAQEAVVRAALANAQLSAADVGYVEAHGTGTELGDPIELHALGSVMNERDPSDPLWVGSLKTNFGHLEAAAGIAGLIKAALCVEHGAIPAHLNLKQPNRHIHWSSLPIEIPRSLRAWPAGKRRIASVSSFGFSGTNAHVVIGAPVEPAPSPPLASSPGLPQPLCISASTERAFLAAQQRLADWIAAHPDTDLAALSHTLQRGRAQLAYRAAVIASDLSQARERLLAAKPQRVRKHKPKLVFMFSGQGDQYPGMGRALYEQNPEFRRCFDECDALARASGLQLRDKVFGGSGSELVQTELSQPATFALSLSLARVLDSCGVRPDAVLGHSIGEYAAACVAGVMSVAQAMPLVIERGRLMQRLPSDGAMAAVIAPEARVLAALRDHPSVSLAAVNRPAVIVISGPRADVGAVLDHLRAEQIEWRPLHVSRAFHSAALDPLAPLLSQAAASVPFGAPTVAFISTVSADYFGPELAFDSQYLARQVRQPVLFWPALQRLMNDDHSVFVELGPSRTLCGLGRRAAADGDVRFATALERGADDVTSVLKALCQLHEAGCSVDIRGLEQCARPRKLRLPGYCFDRAPFWPFDPQPNQRAAFEANPAPAPVHSIAYEFVDTLDV